MKLYIQLLAGLAGIDLGLALILLYEMTKKILNGKREWFGYSVLIFAWGVLGDFLIVVRFMSSPDRVRPGYVIAGAFVILILAGWAMADVSSQMKRERG